MPISERLTSKLGYKFTEQVNCFCISQFYYEDTEFMTTSADQMLDYVNNNFTQIKSSEIEALGLVWSRSDQQIPQGCIEVSAVAKRSPGFPHGLILEHSFVIAGKNEVFQKRDPSIETLVEVTSLESALADYLKKPGFEITWHRKNR